MFLPVRTRRIRPEVQPLIFLYTTFNRKGTPLVYILLTNGTLLTYLALEAREKLPGDEVTYMGFSDMRVKHCVWEINQKQEPITVRRSYFPIFKEWAGEISWPLPDERQGPAIEWGGIRKEDKN